MKANKRPRHEIMIQREEGLTERHQPTPSPKPMGNWKMTKAQRKQAKAKSIAQRNIMRNERLGIPEKGAAGAAFIYWLIGSLTDTPENA